MLSRRVSTAFYLPVLAVAFGVGVLAGLQGEKADPAAPAAVATAPITPVPASPAPADSAGTAPASTAPAPVAEVQPQAAAPARSSPALERDEEPPLHRVSIDRAARDADKDGDHPAEPASGPAQPPERQARREPPAAGPPATVLTIEPSLDVTVAPLAPIALPSGPPGDLKPRPVVPQYSPYQARRFAPKRAPAPQSAEVPILGPLFGFKY